jgi:hypothetical protein
MPSAEHQLQDLGGLLDAAYRSLGYVEAGGNWVR